MSDEISETWTTRELPILRAALRRADAGEIPVDAEDLERELGLDGDQLFVAVTALEDAGYVELIHPGFADIKYVRERARRELGSWPSADTMLERLVAVLEQAAADEPEPEKKTRLRAAADVLGGMARDVAVAAISKQIG